MHATEQLEPLLSEAVKAATAPHAFVDQLLEAGYLGREGRRVRTALRLSSLPTGLMLTEFDFAFQPAIERSRIDTLATCAYIRAAETVLIQGPPGVGKPHLAVGLGVKAVEHGFSAQFYRFDELKLALKGDAHLPPARLRRRKYLNAVLLILDELGYLPFSQAGGALLFHLLSKLYEHTSVMITTKQGDPRLDGTARRRRGAHRRHPRPTAAQSPRPQHQRKELPTQRPRSDPRQPTTLNPNRRPGCGKVAVAVSRETGCRLTAVAATFNGRTTDPRSEFSKPCGTGADDPDPNPDPIPEPATLALLGLGLAGLAFSRRRRS